MLKNYLILFLLITTSNGAMANPVIEINRVGTSKDRIQVKEGWFDGTEITYNLRTVRIKSFRFEDEKLNLETVWKDLQRKKKSSPL